MNERVNKFTAVIMLGFICIFSAAMLLGGKESFSVDENRELTEMPEVSASSLINGSFTEQLSRYAADHFPAREKLIAIDSRIQAELSEKIVNGVFVSGERLLDTGAADRPDTEKSAEAINSFNDSYNGAVYFVCVPTSAGVYSETLPPYMQKNTESRQISSLYSNLSADIRKIDAYNILKMLNDSYIFYRSDSKWTSYGAYCVYRTVIQKLGFSPTAYDKYTIDHVENDFRGDLYHRSGYAGVKADIMDIYRCKGDTNVISCTGRDERGNIYKRHLFDKAELDSSYKYNMYLGKPLPLVKVKTNVNNQRKLLVITDSFGSCFVQFLTQHYSEITVVMPSEIKGSVRNMVDPGKFDQTLFLFGIDSMSDSSIFEKLN
ncbi:MAG TPA: DHHW family protein [Ruminococcus sp.]|nr:DHHW family protein [Ruminococcus sp.]